MSAETVKKIFDAAPDFAASAARAGRRASAGEAWPDPEPLIAPDEASRPYPVDALPGDMQRAVRAYQAYGKQPMALVACSALGSLSLAAQGLANVARDNNLSGPISLNLLVVAESGERKSSADRRMARAIREWLAEKQEDMHGEQAQSRAKVAAHIAERDGLLSKIKSAAGKRGDGDANDLDGFRRQLEEMEAAAPRELIIPELFREDVTPERLAERVAEGWPSSSLWSDEGGLVVGSHAMSEDSAMRFLSLLNRLWDGATFTRERASAKSCTIRGRRFTVSLMVQQVVLARLLGAAGGASRGIGFLARFLLTCPESTMGTRLYTAADLNGPELRAFDRRLRDLLDWPLPAAGDDMVLDPPVLPLSAQARGLWIEYHDEVERELGRLGEFSGVSDFASKSAENAARIAALFHVFQHGPEGEISAQDMTSGAQVAAWHLAEAKRIIGATDRPQAVADGELLLAWFRRRLDEGKLISPRDISHGGPTPLRDVKRRDAATDLLEEKGYLRRPKIDGKTTIVINPAWVGGAQ